MDHRFAPLVIRAANATAKNGTNSTALTGLNSTFILGEKGPHVGSLPLTEFIYVMSGSLIFVACLIPLVSFLQLFIKLMSGIHNETRSDETAQIRPFLDKKPRPQTILEITAQTIVRRQRQAANMQSNLDRESLSFAPPNLPLPVPMPELEVAAPAPEATVEDIHEWQQLIKQKQQLDVAIANLQRVNGVRRRSGAGNAVVAQKLRESSYKLAQLTGSINRTFERFKSLQGTWNPKEWVLISEIHESLQPQGNQSALR